MKYYCYTGDIKKLIPNGWIFQKLYARNYKTYRKGKIIMFVISKMAIEITNLDEDAHILLIKFILDNKNKPESFWQSKSSVDIPLFKNSKFPCWVVQKGEVMSRQQAVANKSRWFKAYESNESIGYLEDGFRIRYSLVKDILELNKTSKLVLQKV